MSSPNINTTQLDSRYIKTVTGLSSTIGDDNTAVLNAAITAAATTSGGGILYLPKGIFTFSGTITLTNGVGLRGAGNAGSGGFGGTELRANAAGASIVVAGKPTDQTYGYGCGIEDIEISGAGVANYPLVINQATDRLFKNVDVHDALLDNITLNYAQNCSFISMTSNYSGRDALVLDNSTGGHIFSHLNVSSPGRHAVKILQSGAAPSGGYPYPTHNTFEACVFERGVSDNSLINIVSGAFTHFTHCMIAASAAQTAASPLATIAFGPHINFDECYWAGVSIANQAAIKSTSSSNRIVINGENKMVNLAYFFDLSNGSVNMLGSVDIGGGSFTTPATPVAGDNNIFRDSNAAMIFNRPDVTKNVLVGGINGESGQRFRIYADGSIGYGDGTGYSFPTKIQRRSDGKVGIIGGLAPNASGTDVYLLKSAADSLYAAVSPSPVRVSRDSSFSLSAGNLTALPFTTETFDTDDWHNMTTNTTRLTCPTGKAGKYMVTATVDYDGSTSGITRSLSILKNGTKTVENVQNSPAAHQGLQVFDIIQFAVGDYVEAAVFSSTACNVSLTYFAPSLSLQFIGV